MSNQFIIRAFLFKILLFVTSFMFSNSIFCQLELVAEVDYENNTTYISEIIGNGNWRNSNGMFIYNNQTSTLSNRFSSITLGSKDGNNNFLTLSKINSIAVGTGQSDLTFQTENSVSSDRLRERMRITSSGTVEINTQNYSDNSLALHTIGNLRFDNLPTGSGEILVYNSALNRVELSSATSSANQQGEQNRNAKIKSLEARILELETKLEKLTLLLVESIKEK